MSDILKTAKKVGGAIGSKTKELGTKTKDTAQVIGKKTKNIGGKVGDKALDTAQVIGKKTKNIGGKVGDKAFDTAVTIGVATMNLGETVGATLQRINLGKLIDDLEEKQVYADKLEFINQEIVQEQERKELCREAEARCRDTIIHHLHEFLTAHPLATYEEWISELHPDNVTPTKPSKNVNESDNDMKIDHRFYVIDSDHRLIWNGFMEELAAKSVNGDDTHYATRMISSIN